MKDLILLRLVDDYYKSEYKNYIYHKELFDDSCLFIVIR